MSRDETLICYFLSMSSFQSWLNQGIISEDELRQIDTIIAEKYGISSYSIFRVIT
jgi:hypothetical protein